MTGWIAWGGAGHAKVLRDCIRDLPLVAVFDNADVAPPFPDVPLYRGKAAFADWRSRNTGAIGFLIAIGGPHGAVRRELHEWLAAQGLNPLTAIHRSAFVADSAVIGAGSQILAQAAVCVEAVLGEDCIVNTGAVVDHECRLGAGVHIGPGAQLAGCVEIADHAFVGTGATVIPRIKVGARAVIGAGSVVVRDVPADTIVVGVPAHPLARNP